MAKKKINDDTFLQLIRDGNSPAGAARFFVGGKLRKCSAREDKTRHQLQPFCQCASFRIFQHIICISDIGPIVHRIAPLCSSFLRVPDRRPGDPIRGRKLSPPALPRLRVRISRLRGFARKAVTSAPPCGGVDAAGNPMEAAVKCKVQSSVACRQW